MADIETTTFPKMSDEDVTDHIVNISGQRSPYMTYVQRKSKNDDPPNSPKGNRKSVLQPAQLTGAAHKIRTVLSGGQPDAPSGGYAMGSPYKRNAATAANPDPGPLIVEDDGWR